MQNDVHTLWALFVALWSYLCTSYPENDGPPFARHIFLSPTGDVCSPALHEPLQLPTACWDWCKTPLRVPQAHQGVSPHVRVSPQAGHRWLVVAHGKVATVAGQLLPVPHHALLHKIFLHPCLPGKKYSKSLLYFFSSWRFLWLKSLQANAWWLVNLAGGHLSPSSTSLFKYLGWLSFRSLGLCLYHSLATINDFICLNFLRDWMDWLQVVIKILKRDLKLGTEFLYSSNEISYWNLLWRMSQKGRERKKIVDCCLIQAYKQYRGRLFSDVLNKGTGQEVRVLNSWREISRFYLPIENTHENS